MKRTIGSGKQTLARSLVGTWPWRPISSQLQCIFLASHAIDELFEVIWLAHPPTRLDVPMEECSIFSHKKFVRTLAVTTGGLLLATVIGNYFLGRLVKSNALATLFKAEQYLRQKKNSEARDTLKWLLWYEPTHPRALLISGISLNADRKFLEAILVLERIHEKSESAEAAGIALASSLIHDEQLDRAESMLRRHLENFPNSSAAQEQLVQLNIRLLRQREAIDFLNEVWRRGSEDFGALPLLLELQAKPLTPHEIISSLESTNRKYPRQPLVVLALARAYSLLGKLEPAQAHFDLALQLKPKDLETRVLAAEFAFNRGDRERARELLESDVANLSDDDRLAFQLCRLAEMSGDLERAYRQLDLALQRRPHEHAYVYMQSTLLRRLGRFEESRTASARATELAELRKRLLILSNKFDRYHPDKELCEEIADLLERFGCHEQAEGWRRVSELIKPATTP